MFIVDYWSMFTMPVLCNEYIIALLLVIPECV